MRITHIISSLSDGGAEGVLFRLIKHTGVEIHHKVISLQDEGKYGPLLKQAGIEVHCLNFPKGKISPKGLVLLYRLLKSEKPEKHCVQTWLYHADLLGGIVAKLAGHKQIFWGIRNNEIHKNARLTKFIARLCAPLSYWIPAGVICCSEKAARYHTNLGYKNDFYIVSNGYDFDQFYPSQKSRKSTRKALIPENPFAIGMVARWDPQKDHETLFSAISTLQRSLPEAKFKLILVGTDCDNKNRQLMQLLHKYHLRPLTLLLGRRTDIFELLNAFDIHALSSLSEAFPNAIAEAMACGVTCVSTQAGEAETIIGDTGFTCPVANPQALAESLMQCYEALQNPETKKSLSEKATQRIREKYSMPQMCDNYVDIWKFGAPRKQKS